MRLAAQGSPSYLTRKHGLGQVLDEDSTMPGADRGIHLIIHVRQHMRYLFSPVVFRQLPLAVCSEGGEPVDFVALVVGGEAHGKLVPHEVPHGSRTMANARMQSSAELSDRVRLVDAEQELLAKGALMEPVQSFFNVHGVRVLSRRWCATWRVERARSWLWSATFIKLQLSSVHASHHRDAGQLRV